MMLTAIVACGCFVVSGGCTNSRTTSPVRLAETGTVLFIEPPVRLPGIPGPVESLECLDVRSGLRGQWPTGGRTAPTGWSVEGDMFCACIDGVWKVLSLSSGTTICTFPGNHTDSRISPALDRVALMEEGPDVWAVDESDVHKAYGLGKRCRLRVFGVPSGKLVKECDHFALNFGFCWGGRDGTRVVFVSFTNAENFAEGCDIPPECDTYEYPGPPDKYPTYLHLLDPDTGRVMPLCQGLAPQRLTGSSDVTFHLGDVLHRATFGMGGVYDIRKIDTATRAEGYTVSPGGRYVLSRQAPYCSWSGRVPLIVWERESLRVVRVVSDAVVGTHAWVTNSQIVWDQRGQSRK